MPVCNGGKSPPPLVRLGNLGWLRRDPLTTFPARPLIAALIGDSHVMGWGNKGIEIRSVETGQMDGIFMHKKTQKLRFLCERNDKVSITLLAWSKPPALCLTFLLSTGLLCFHKVILKLSSLLHGPQPSAAHQVAPTRANSDGGHMERDYFHNTCLYIHRTLIQQRSRID